MTATEPGPPPVEPTGAVEGDLLEADLLGSSAAGATALRGSVLRTGGYVLGILLSLIAAPLLVRHLGVADFGRYVTVLSLMTIVAGVTEGGLNTVVLREFATLDDAHRRAMMRLAIGIRLVMTIAGVALAIGFAVVAGYGQTFVLGTTVAGIGLVIQLVQSVFSVTLQAQLRFGWVSAVELLRQAVNVALIVALVLSGAGLVPLLAVSIPASVVSLALTVPLVLPYISLKPSVHLARWWRLLRETVPWAVISAVNIIYFRVSIVLLSLIASGVQTGYFATSFRITEVLVAIPILVVSAAFPILARAERDDRERFTYASSRIFQLALVAGTWLVLCLEVIAPFAIHVLAGHKADPAIAVLRIQGAALLANFVNVACGVPLLTMRRYRLVLSANLLALFVSAALTLALAPSLGARGAAIAALVAEVGAAISQTVMLRRVAPDVDLSVRAVAAVLLAGAASVAIGVALPVHPVIGTVIASAAYFGMLSIVGRFPPEIRELLTRPRRSVARHGTGP